MTTAISPAEAADTLLRRRRARERLLPFCEYTLPGYISAPHLELLADRLEAVESGELKRLIVTMPPRHGKTEHVSIRFPAWYLGRHPERKVVQAGYAESIALAHSRSARDVFVGQMPLLFPHVIYRPERRSQETVIPQRQAAHEWGTVQGGSYYAVGVGGGLTGRGFDVGIIDDPIKDDEEAQSAVLREKVWQWWQKVFLPRSEPGAAIVVVMTRWHADDLVGRLLATEASQWEVLHLRAVDNGRALWPERYPLEVLEQRRESMGSRAFAALYQGEPVIEQGNIIKRDWWRYYDVEPEFERLVYSWDTGFKEKTSSDPSVGLLWGQTSNALYLLDVWRDRVEFPDLKRAVVSMWERRPGHAVLVEDAASGQSLIQELRRDTIIPIIAVKVDKSKVARANASAPVIESGRVFLPRSAPWLFDYIEELAAFPNAPNDDQVDGTTQAITYMMPAISADIGITI